MSEFNRQTAALENNLLVLHFLQQHPRTPQDKLPGILVWHARRFNLSDSVWKTAQQSNVTALMPQDEVRNLAATYERIDAVDRGFDDIWPVIIQARIYALADPDPSHLTPAELAAEIDLAKAALAVHFAQAGTLVQLSSTDPGFVPHLQRDDLTRMMRLSETEESGGLNRSMQHWLAVYSPGFKAQGLSRALIEAQGYLVEIGLRVAGQVGFLGEVLS